MNTERKDWVRERERYTVEALFTELVDSGTPADVGREIKQPHEERRGRESNPRTR